MTRIRASRKVAAPPEAVFRALTDLQGMSEVFPAVSKVEVLEGPDGTRPAVGTRFRETRRTGDRDSVTELEIVEFVPCERVRFLADGRGTLWDTVMTVAPAPEGTELTITMEAHARAALPRIVNPLMRRVLRRTLAEHAEAVACWCERGRDGAT